MVEHQLPKLRTRVRFPSSALTANPRSQAWGFLRFRALGEPRPTTPCRATERACSTVWAASLPRVIDHRTVRSYDIIANDYAEGFAAELAEKPLWRAMLRVFAETTTGPIADIGCGTGHSTAFLHELGADVSGIDPSTGMIETARRLHPDLRFELGSMTALDLPDESLGGVLGGYSIIHLDPADLPAAFAEFHRVLRPGSRLLLAFQVGEQPLHLTEAFGHSVDLTFHRHAPQHVTALLADAGIHVTATLEREADPGERTPHAHLLATKPS
jgi:SAM-dependent methyltransferase